MREVDAPALTRGGGSHRKKGAIRPFLRMCFPTRPAFALALLVCVAAPTLLIVTHIHENPQFSPIDEAAHWDYITRIAHGAFPRLGQRLQPTTLRALSCRGTALSAIITPPCSQRVLKPDEFEGGGYQYEAQQPPVYYAITVPMRWVAIDVVGMGDVGGTRASGIVWLCVGLLVLWAAGRVVGLASGTIGAAVLLIGSTPLVIYQASSISNGAASIFVGSSILLLAALAWRHPGRWVVPVLAAGGFVAVAIAEPNILPVVVASTLLGVLGMRPPEVSSAAAGKPIRRFLRASWPAGGALLIGGVASALAWVAISRNLAIINPKKLPPFEVLRTGPRGLEQIARESLLLLGPVTDSYNVYRAHLSAAAQNLRPVIDEVHRTLFLAGGLAGIFVGRRRWYHWMGLSSVATLYLGGLVLGIGLWLSYDIDPSLAGRYGMSVAPFLALGLVAAIRGRWVLGALWAVALATFATTLGFTLVG